MRKSSSILDALFGRDPNGSLTACLSSFRLTHCDANPAGIRVGEWEGFTLGVAPRAKMQDLVNRMTTTPASASVYLLLGADGGRACAREGEGDVDQRLRTHRNDRQRHWFDRVAIFTCDDMKTPTGKDMAQVVECLMARQLQHNVGALVHKSDGPSIKHRIETEMWKRGTEIVLTLRSLAPLLGVHVFEPLDSEDTASFDNSVRGFYEQWPNGRLRIVGPTSPETATAPTKRLRLSDFTCTAEDGGDGEWRLLAGSQIKKTAVPSAPLYCAERRKALIRAKHLVPVPGYPDRMALTVDHRVGSMASVNEFVMGSSMTSRRYWHDVHTAVDDESAIATPM